MSRLLSGRACVLASDTVTPLAKHVRARRRATRFALSLALTATVGLSGGAAVSLAAVGSVYVDANHNVGAGHDSFNGSFSGVNDVGLGYSVMPQLTTGSNNVAAGAFALSGTTTGFGNIAAGTDALFLNTSGHDNVGTGVNALGSNTRGHDNLALGSGAGANLTTGSNNIDIANAGVAGEAGKIRIGTNGKQTAAFLAGVSGASIAGPVKPVVINANGRLGTAKSPSASLKRKVRPLRVELTRQRRQLRHQAQEIRRLRKEVLVHR